MVNRRFGDLRPLRSLLDYSTSGSDRNPVQVSNDKAEKVIQDYVDFLSKKYGVEAPDVKIWEDDVWIQVVIDPETVEANYDSSLQRINLNERDIKFKYVVHEFAHHLVHYKDDIDSVLQKLIDSEDVSADVIEHMNEMQTETIANEIAQERDVRNNWNQLVALGTGLEKVEVSNS